MRLDKVPASFFTLSISDFYRGGGNFSGDFDFSVDLYNMISKIADVPEDIRLLFDTLVITGSINADLTFNNLYRVNIMGPDGRIHTAFLPAGASLDLLAKSSVFAPFAASGFIRDDLSGVAVMPSGDTMLYSDELYTVRFEIDGNFIGSAIYPFGATQIDIPAIPPEYQPRIYYQMGRLHPQYRKAHRS